MILTLSISKEKQITLDQHISTDGIESSGIDEDTTELEGIESSGKLYGHSIFWFLTFTVNVERKGRKDDFSQKELDNPSHIRPVIRIGMRAKQSKTKHKLSFTFVLFI
ncbi:hypothetical protein RJT34_04110 [Clitoria ternatea]|uniref:Uncharacterized protein n=1 Tax=Clitoria ternatea TaxID=43366 RepID=A0AAN9KP53_CLITE